MGKIDSKTDGDFFAQLKVKIDASEDILQRLRDMDVMESRSAHFCQKLCAHFDRLPASYATKVKFDGIKVVLKHMKLLDLAKTSANCPAIDVCEVEVHPSDEEINRSTQPLYEITCATTNKSELFSHFTAVLHLMNLRIKELSLLSTTDGYSLLVFVVTGVPQRLEKPGQLRKALRKEFLKTDQVVGLRRIDQPEWPRLYVAKMLYYGGIALLAVYCAGAGIAMMHGKRPGLLFESDYGFLGIFIFLSLLLKYFVEEE